MIGVLKSLGVTMGTMFRKPVTIQYPTEHKKVPERVLSRSCCGTSMWTNRSAQAVTRASVRAPLSA